MGVGDFFAVTTQWAHASFFLRILERDLQDLVNDGIDLLFGRIEFDTAASTVHGFSKNDGPHRFVRCCCASWCYCQFESIGRFTHDSIPAPGFRL
jgi:hypothetical protein